MRCFVDSVLCARRAISITSARYEIWGSPESGAPKLEQTKTHRVARQSYFTLPSNALTTEVISTTTTRA